jgi:hypothetical protein
MWRLQNGIPISETRGSVSSLQQDGATWQTGSSNESDETAAYPMILASSDDIPLEIRLVTMN